MYIIISIERELITTGQFITTARNTYFTISMEKENKI